LTGGARQAFEEFAGLVFLFSPNEKIERGGKRKGKGKRKQKFIFPCQAQEKFSGTLDFSLTPTYTA
jgi:hypothetical protein